MNEQIAKIYYDVLVHNYKIFVKHRVGNKFYIVTYYPYPPMMEMIKNGYPLDVVLEQTSYHDYILEDDDDSDEETWEVRNNLIYSK